MSGTGVVTITLNAAIDTTYVIDGFVPGGSFRPRQRFDMPGGKGNNVARVLRTAGHAVVASGFRGGHTGERIASGLVDAGIDAQLVSLGDRESRTCIAVLDPANSRSTEILESGPTVDDADYRALMTTLEPLLPDAGAVVVSGSAPAGSTRDDLASLARFLRDRVDRFVVDSSGPTLDALLDGRPDLIAPNEHEIDALIGSPSTLEERLRHVRRHLLDTRMAPGGRVLLTMGASGGALVTAGETLVARLPALQPVNTVGCGDATLAGAIDAWLAGASGSDLLRQAMAFGAAAALQPVAGSIDPADVTRLSPGIDITPLPADGPLVQRTTQ